MSKPHTLQSGLEVVRGLISKIERRCTPVMQDVSRAGAEVFIYPKDQLKAIGMVELTKSLTADDVVYLIQEVYRINKDHTDK